MKEFISSLMFQPESGEGKREMTGRGMKYDTSPSREIEEKENDYGDMEGTKRSNHSHGKTASTLRE